jgi:hypothetical protein
LNRDPANSWGPLNAIYIPFIPAGTKPLPMRESSICASRTNTWHLLSPLYIQQMRSSPNQKQKQVTVSDRLRKRLPCGFFLLRPKGHVVQ